MGFTPQAKGKCPDLKLHNQSRLRLAHKDFSEM